MNKSEFNSMRLCHNSDQFLSSCIERSSPLHNVATAMFHSRDIMFKVMLSVIFCVCHSVLHVSRKSYFNLFLPENFLPHGFCIFKSLIPDLGRQSSSFFKYCTLKKRKSFGFSYRFTVVCYFVLAYQTKSQWNRSLRWTKREEFQAVCILLQRTTSESWRHRPHKYSMHNSTWPLNIQPNLK